VTLPADVAATFCATLVDEWARAGVTDAVVCPGSRSTPLAVALAADRRIDVHVRLDERGGGFFALGMALATGRPVVVLTTSGTAAAELHASVVEAHQARVPLVVCTADRPPELHHVGAPQTIDQTHLYGGAVRLFVEPGVADEAAAPTWRSLASRAVLEATAGPLGPGPVHLNLAFREPLLGTAGELPPGRPEGAPWHGAVRGSAPAADTVAELARLLRATRRGVVLAGGGAGGARPELVTALAGRLGWPILADPRARCAEPAGDGRAVVVGAADTMLRARPFAEAMRPDLVLRVGALPASKALATWLDGAPQVAVDPHWAWQDPGRQAAQLVAADPDAVLTLLLGELGAPGAEDASSWAGEWRRAEEAAQSAIDAVLAGNPEPTEPAVARRLYALAEGDSSIVASSSMPVRDLEWFARPRSGPPRVLANRGANGIDGVVSTLLGVAAASKGMRTYGLVGDLALLHDASALVRSATATTAGGRFRCVVVDNAGGGIFSFLPQAAALDEATFEQLFGTPQLPALGDLVAASGYACSQPDTMDRFEEAVGEDAAGFVLVRTERKANVRLHAALAAAVKEAVSS